MNAAPRRPVTLRQAEVLEAIRAFIAKNGFAPSTRELAELIGVTRHAAQDHLRFLEKKRLVALEPGTARGIRLIDPVPAVPVIAGTAESLCGVLDRIERRMPDIDYPAVRLDLCLARQRIEEILGRIVREIR